MALIDEVEALETKEGKLTTNKVANFCYEDSAYIKDEANGVRDFEFGRAQNIPVADNSVIKVSDVVTTKGFRSQASALPRMTLNHFFGRVSFNLNKTVDVLHSFLSSFKTSLGTANGVATLDANGRIPYSQLPESAIEYKGNWNADTNTPTLEDGTGTKGDFYIVSVAGSQDLGSGTINFLANDQLIYTGSIWEKLAAGDVKRVNSISPVDGNITLTGENINVDSTDDSDTVSNRIESITSDTQDLRNDLTDVEDKVEDILLGVDPVGAVRPFEFAFEKATINDKLENMVVNKFATNGSVIVGVGRISSGSSSATSPSLLVYSEDKGKNWETLSFPNLRNLNRVIYSGDKFVAAGRGGFAYSTDGKTWSVSTITSNYAPTNLLYANGAYICTYDTYGYSTPFISMYASTDGEVWDSVLTDKTVNNCIYVEDLSMFVAVGDNYVGWSTDGIDWVAGTSSVACTFLKVCYGNGLLVAVGSSVSGSTLYSASAYSTDGKTWTAKRVTTNHVFRKVMFISEYNVFTVSGSANTVGGVWYGTGDNTWLNIALSSSVSSISELIYSKHNHRLLCLTGDKGLFSIEFSQAGVPTGDFNKGAVLFTSLVSPQGVVGYCNGLFYSSTERGYVISSNGQVWGESYDFDDTTLSCSYFFMLSDCIIQASSNDIFYKELNTPYKGYYKTLGLSVSPSSTYLYNNKSFVRFAKKVETVQEDLLIGYTQSGNNVTGNDNYYNA